MTVVQAIDGATCVGEVGGLYRRLAPRLERIVRLDVRAGDAVIEDACQFAWSRLVHHADRVRADTVLAWLARVAVHEALRLLRRERRELSLEGESESLQAHALWSSHPPPEVLYEHRERLAVLAGLPERERRMVWLHALGLSYGEIATYSGCTVRTVERQLLRGKQRLRAMDGGPPAQ
jgi:RNA polymerase sigma-70 factor (ECF subfamily)